ncbi:MAG: hypothetical protein ACWA5X_10425 [bacterium]
MRKFLMVLLILGIAGCSNKYMYDKFRMDERNKCVKEPPTTYVECVERTGKSYEEYERERKAVLERDKQKDAGGADEKRMGNHKE